MHAFTRGVLVGARGLNRAAIAAVGVVTLVLVGVVVLQVVFRYVLELPLVWSDEAARHLLVWLSFLGGGVAIAQGLHPRIELIDAFCGPAVRRTITIVVSLLVLVFLVILLVVSADVAKTYHGYLSLGLGIPQSIPRAALPVGACLMAINVLVKLLEAVVSPSRAEESITR
jgi:TRAP-type transport system small permease protein